MSDERTVAAQVVTPEAFAAFGHVVAEGVDAPAGALRLGGGEPRLWVMALADRPPRVERITRHRAVSQALASADAQPWMIAVAAPAADPASDPDAVSAFLVPPAVALVLHVGTWHAGPLFHAPSMRFFNLELADTNEADHDTVALPAPLRIALPAEAAAAPVRRVLVVANRTTASPELGAALRRLAGTGARLHVVVPATVPGRSLHALAAPGDPMAGLPTVAVELSVSPEIIRREAQQRLEALLAELHRDGIDATGEVGPSDPLAAIEGALADHPADELLISTLPSGLSKWLSRDLPSRAARRFGLPVTHVEAASPGNVAP